MLLSADGGEIPEELAGELRHRFEKMMRALFNQKGARLELSLLETEEAQRFIETHASVLDSTFDTVPMSDILREKLQSSDYVFSGMKTFHELNEAFPSLIDENGDRKPFERFLNDVRKVDETYNRDWLRAEYNFVHASAQMAAQWEKIERDGDRYNLQYRTAGDGKVRPEHAALNRITLPPSDPFWDEFYPPNGWGCRCTAVQVLKSKYPVSDHDEALKLGEAATVRDKRRMFRFNAGKQRKTVPDYNPYTTTRCRDCGIASGKSKLARPFIPDNELCAACAIVHRCLDDKTKSDRARERTHYLHEMEHLLKKSEMKKTEGKDIKVGFTAYGNKHLYSDTFGRSKVVTKDDLASLDSVLKEAKFMGESELTHPRTDGIDRFLYYESKIRGEKVRLNVARKVKTRKNGKQQYSYFLYSINDI